MDLLRIDTVDGPVHFRPDDVKCLARSEEDPTNKAILTLMFGGTAVQLVIPYDADEVAAQFETNYPACRIWRLN